MVFALQYQTI